MDAVPLVCGVERNGGYARDEGVLLHVHPKECVEAKLDKLPEDADGHREAKGNQRYIDRGEADVLARPVEKVDKGEANGRAEKAVERVQDGVPARNQHVVVVNLSENLCGEDERIDNCLEEAGNLYMGHPLDERWDEE